MHAQSIPPAVADDGADRYESLCAFLPWGVLVLDDEDRIGEANPAAARLLGAPGDRLRGASLRAYVAEPSVGALLDALAHCRRARTTADVALALSGRDGRQRHVRAHVQAQVQDRVPPALRYRVALLDVTDARQAHLTLRNLADEMNDLYQNAPCGYHSTDPDGVVLQINDTELRWLGYQREEVVRRMCLTDLLPPQSRAEFESAFEALKRGARVRDLQIEMRRRDGSAFPILLSATAVTDGRGQFLRSRASVFDISRRRHAEEEARGYARRLKAMSQRAVEAQEAERRRIAHELHDSMGQTLTALNINLNIIKGRLAPAPDAVISSRLEDSLKLVEATVDNTRRVIADLRPAVLDDYGLAAALRWYAEQFSVRTGVAVRVSGQDPRPRLASTVEATLFRIAQESLTNVAKHAAAREARVLLETREGRFFLSVVDDGRGFDPARLRCPNNSHGWGLMIMRERADADGGELHVESAPGQGTRVVIEMRL
ncbi:MAG TPA: PAS domain-containing protein [Burkholderiaceae bacterium]|nr:PAS domain-containing protein [Burkholderiaceae bacterium]